MQNIIKIYSLKEFKSMLELKNIDDNNIDTLHNEFFISISCVEGPDKQKIFNKSHNNLLSLYFDDVEEDGYQTCEPVMPGKIWQYAMTKKQAKDSINFIKKILKTDAIIHIHCQEGQSRSVAFGVFLTDYFKLDIDKFIHTHNPNYNKFVYKILKNESL